MNKRTFGIIIGIAVLVFASLACGEGTPKVEQGTVALTSTPGPTRTPTPDVSDGGIAEVTCQDFVSARLKSPATAKFSPWRETQITEMGSQEWTVRGYVDSQNSFGAMIRTRYTCRVKYRGGGSWVLLGLDFF